jgi:hypothetical protein
VLGALHDDSLPASAVQGDLLVANATPAWARKARAAAKAGLVMRADGLEPDWSTGNLEQAFRGENRIIDIGIPQVGQLWFRSDLAATGNRWKYGDANGAVHVIPRDHNDLDSIGANDHHLQLHAAAHVPGGGDILQVTATDRVLGRDSAGGGNVEEITAAALLTMLGAYSNAVLQAFVATGTYTPTAGMKHCLVFITGSGGGGAGADTDGSSGSIGAGGGGGAGGTAIGRFTAAQIGVSQAVTIGVAGSGGSAAGASGVAGGNSTFGALLTGNGGGAGIGGGTSAVDFADQAGGAGGVSSGGTLNVDGGDGGSAIGGGVDGTTDLSFAKGGSGGASFWGGGGRGGAAANATLVTDKTEAGIAGKAYGAGGGGGADLNATVGVAGGAGKVGCCLVIEFV